MFSISPCPRPFLILLSLPALSESSPWPHPFLIVLSLPTPSESSPWPHPFLIVLSLPAPSESSPCPRPFVILLSLPAPPESSPCPRPFLIVLSHPLLPNLLLVHIPLFFHIALLTDLRGHTTKHSVMSDSFISLAPLYNILSIPVIFLLLFSYIQRAKSMLLFECIFNK